MNPPPNWRFLLMTGGFKSKFNTLGTNAAERSLVYCNTVSLIIFACLNFCQFVILGPFTKSRIRELSISMIGSAHNKNFSDFFKFANLSSSRNLRKLKPREYYQIYTIDTSMTIQQKTTKNPLCYKWILNNVTKK